MIIEYMDKKYADVSIDTATAALEQLNEAYSYLLNRGYSSAFPGSSEAKKAAKFARLLREMIAARPEVEQYRKDTQSAKNKTDLANSYVD